MKVNINTCRNFATTSLICAAVSLLAGGVLLDALGVAFGFYAYVNARRIVAANPQDLNAVRVLKLTRNSIIFCVVAAVLNAATILIVLPSTGSLVSGGGSVSAF